MTGATGPRAPGRSPRCLGRRLRLGAAAFLAVGLLAAASSACAGGEDALTIYSGRGRSLVGPLLDRFAQEAGIPIEVRYGNSAELALLISEEGERTPADVFYAQNPGAVGFLAERDLLQPLSDTILATVDARFRSDRGHWVGVTGRQRVLVYNTEQVDDQQLPRSVFDLTHERYRGRVGVAPTNGSFQDFVSAMQQVYGEERTLQWLTALANNEPRTYGNNNAIVEAVARGEVAMGLVNHYYNHRWLDEDPTLPSRNYVFPDGDIGALLIASTVSVVSDDPRAQRFVGFLVSEEAQRYFAEETFEYPLARGVQPAADLPPLGSLTLPKVDIEELGDELRATIDLIERSGLRR
ncbi:MAG: iron ABC transporter substrate-binding protein [Actinobacteria bacterium]|nr:iron ABC transporter substrate-binding protein [Actinomycetota bacterium]